MLGQAGRLSERQRVKPRLSLLLIRIRYFVVSLIPWSEAMSRPPSPAEYVSRTPLFSDDRRQGVNELNSWHARMFYDILVKDIETTNLIEVKLCIQTNLLKTIWKRSLS